MVTDIMNTDKQGPELLAKLFKLLSDPNRVRIISAIGEGEKSVSEIIEETSLSQTLVSFHLRPLRESGILLAERKGPFIYYHLSDPSLIGLLRSLSSTSFKPDKTQEKEVVCPPMRFMREWMKGGR
jgi:DNA-binding transcriptional ArsR family regulator